MAESMTEVCALCGAGLAAKPGQGVRCSRCGLVPISESSAELTLVRRATTGEFASDGAPIRLTPEFLACYRLERVVGAGAMGLVVLGVLRKNGRAVAIKVCVALDHESLQRFMREGALLETLDHPNVVPVLEVGYLERHAYMVGEFMPGGTLRERITRDRVVPAEEAARIARDVAAGLAACHARGVVHRDIKPPNILFGADGVARIADLGIARDLTADGELTNTGVILGTPKYLSPEQAMGEKAVPSSDLYATGVVLYEMLVGAPPFDAENLFQLLQKHITLPPRPLASIDPTLPAPLCELVHRLLSKKVADRPASAEELVGLLDRLYPPAPPQQPERRRRPRTATRPGPIASTAAGRRFPRAATLVGALLVVLLVLAVQQSGPEPDAPVSPSPLMSASEEPRSPSPQLPPERSPSPTASAPSPTASAPLPTRAVSSVARSTASGAFPSSPSPSPVAASPSPSASSPAVSGSPSPSPSASSPAVSGSPSPSPSASSAAVSVPSTSPFPLPAGALLQFPFEPHAGIGPPSAIALSPRRELTAVGWESGHLTCFDRSGKIVSDSALPWPAEVPAFTPVTQLHFSPDGRFLSVGWTTSTRWAVRALAVDGPPRPHGEGLGGTGSRLIALGITDAGQLLAAHASPTRVTLAPSGITVETGTDEQVGAAFSRAGDRAVVASARKGLECWDLAKPERLSVSLATDLSGCVALNVTGGIVIAGLAGDRQRLVGFADGQEISEKDGSACPLARTGLDDVLVKRSDQPGCLLLEVTGKLDRPALIAARPPVAFSADGASVAMGSWRGGVDVWTTTALLDILRHGAARLSVPVAPGLWWRRLEPGGIVGVPAFCAPAGVFGLTHLHQPAAQSVAMGDHGRVMAVLSESGALDARTLPAGKPLSRIVVHVEGGRAGVVRLLPDERRAILVPPRPTDLLGFTVGVTVAAQAARLYDLESGQLRATYSGHEKAIYDASISPDGSHLATAAADETVRIFKIEPAEPRSVLTGHASGVFRSVSWSPDGLRVAAQAGAIERTCVWRVARGDLEVSLVHTGILRGASYFASERELVLVGRHTVALARLPADTARSQNIPPGVGIFWERLDQRGGTFNGPVEWKPLCAAPKGLEFISSALSEDRKLLTLGLDDGRAWILKLPKGQDPPREVTVHPDVPESLALSHDGRWLAVGGARTVIFDLGIRVPDRAAEDGKD